MTPPLADKRASPKIKLVVVPCVDIRSVSSSLSTARKLSDLLRFFRCSDTNAVASMLRHTEPKAMSHRELSSAGMLHPRAGGYYPVFEAHASAGRSLSEIRALQAVPRLTNVIQSKESGLIDWLLNVADELQLGGFRTGPITTNMAADRTRLVYPDRRLIEDQIKSLEALIIRSIGDRRESVAPFAMNVLFNLHPFADGNGRIGRILFNAICRDIFDRYSYLPLSEIFYITQGSMTLFLRGAQYFGYWDEYYRFIDHASRFALQVLLRGTGRLRPK